MHMQAWPITTPRVLSPLREACGKALGRDCRDMLSGAGTVHLDNVHAGEHIPAKASAGSKLSAEMQLSISTDSAYHRGRAERGGLPGHSWVPMRDTSA